MSLRDQLLSLTSVEPEKDPEDADFGDETLARVGGESDSDDAGAVAHGGLRVGSGFTLDEVDEAYAGKTVSRQSLGFEADRDEEESSGSELEESDVEAGRGDLSSPSEGESEVDEEDEEGEHAPEEGYTDESEDEDAGVALRLVQTSTEDKKEKGKHAMNQRSMWEVLLEQRIRCQPILTTAARLPQTARLLMKSIPDLAGAKSGAESSLRKLLAQLLRLRALLVHQHPQVSAGVKRSWSGKQKLDDEESMILGLSGSRKRRRVFGKSTPEEEKLEESSVLSETMNLGASKLWTVASRGWDSLKPWALETLDEWHERGVLATSVNEKRALQALERNISGQVKAVLESSHQVYDRSFAKKGSVDVVGTMGEEDEDDEEEVDREIYDDTAFYQEMLRDFVTLTQKQAEERGSVTLKARERSDKPKKDHRLAGERKINYMPRPAIVNFMAPIPLNETSIDRDVLFASLFQ